MSLSPKLSSTFNSTHLKNGNAFSPLSGMCATCSIQCTGTCEIGLSAKRSIEAAYPYETNTHQFGSEKKYPLDFSHFNINGRVFGSEGYSYDLNSELPAEPNVYSVNLERSLGHTDPIQMKMPILLPAMAKLNWRDYFSGAAMAGIIAVIGENVVKNDPQLAHDHEGKVINAPLLGEMINCFREYEKGYGDIVLQINADDVSVGTAEYALSHFPIKSIEIKFGQAAKGIQHVAPVYDALEALKIKKNGYLIHPDPEDASVMSDFNRGIVPYFIQYGRLPLWQEQSLKEYIQKLRLLGAKHIFFKMAGYDCEDIQRVLRMASDNGVTLVTFDGAGGGTGHSPSKMMNEWGHTGLELLGIVKAEMKKLDSEGHYLPAIALAGGFVFEDSVFKALALGAPYIQYIGIGRGAMAAAMATDDHSEANDVSFVEKNRLYSVYETNDLRNGGIGVFSYLERVAWGLKLFMTLNRKFRIDLLESRDVIPLSYEAKNYLKVWNMK